MSSYLWRITKNIRLTFVHFEKFTRLRLDGTLPLDEIIEPITESRHIDVHIQPNPNENWTLAQIRQLEVFLEHIEFLLRENCYVNDALPNNKPADQV
jgi:hypothetical protein